MHILGVINEWFWEERLWLPKHLSWDDFRNTADKKFGHPQDFVAVIPLAIVVFCVRIVLEKAVAMRMGMQLNLSHSHQPSINRKTKKEHHGKGDSPHEAWHLAQNGNGQLTGMKQTEQTIVQKSPILMKFSETFWRFAFYLSMFVYGIYALYDEECTYRRTRCWQNFPEGHHLTLKIHWYYMVEMAFYVATTTTQFCDVKRKDFWEMFVHHIVTMMLMFGSYSMNYTKIGSVILIVHDSADFYLEFAKLGKYANSIRVTNIGFLLFTLAFFLSRLVILPFWVIPTIWFEGLKGYKVYSVIYVLFCALLVLQVLHFYWFSHILRALYSTVVYGEIRRDTRSDSEDPHETDGGNNVKVKKTGPGRRREFKQS